MCEAEAVVDGLDGDGLLDAGGGFGLVGEFVAVLDFGDDDGCVVGRVGARCGLGCVPEAVSAIELEAVADVGQGLVGEDFEDVVGVADPAADDAWADGGGDGDAEVAGGHDGAVVVVVDAAGFHGVSCM